MSRPSRPRPPLTPAQQALAEANVPLALWVCRGVRLPPGHDRDDLVGEAVLGLVDAAALYDPSRGVAFSTYASLAALRRALAHARRAWKSASRGDRGCGLETGAAAEGDGPLLLAPARVERASEIDPELVARLRAHLTPREWRVLELYALGLDMREIAQQIGRSKQRVHQMMARVRQHLRAKARKGLVTAWM